MKHYKLTAGLILTSLAACSEQAPKTQIQTPSVTASVTSGEILISNPYILPPFPGRDVAAGFFEIKNTGATDKLISASSSASTSVEIHNHVKDDGIMRMRRVESVEISTGDTIEFKPGSYHLMMFGASFEDSQKTIEVTFNYEKAGPVTLTVPIRRDDDDETDAIDEQSKGSASHYGSGSEPDEDAKKETYGSGH